MQAQGTVRLHELAIAAFHVAAGAGHHGLAGAVNVSVQQAHLGAFCRQGQRQVDGGGAFAHTAFARGHGNDVFHARQRLHTALHAVRHHGGAQLYIHSLYARHLACGGLQLRTQLGPQALRGVGQRQFERDARAVNAQLAQHFRVGERFACVGVLHAGQCCQ